MINAKLDAADDEPTSVDSVRQPQNAGETELKMMVPNNQVRDGGGGKFWAMAGCSLALVVVGAHMAAPLCSCPSGRPRFGRVDRGSDWERWQRDQRNPSRLPSIY